MMDLMKQVFEVGNIDENIDLSMPPTSGEEYIKRVVMEAKNCADVVVADLDSSLTKKIPLKNYCELLPGCTLAPPNLSPTLEWQKIQVRDFSDVRSYLSRIKDEKQANTRKWIGSPVTLPDINDQYDWVRFCNDVKIIPTLDIIVCFTQPLAVQVLEYLTEWLESEGRLDYNIGQWIYALLVILEQPLFPDTCYTLRRLARSCSYIRAITEYNPKKAFAVGELEALNLFICLVARYFQQLDLADP